MNANTWHSTSKLSPQTRYGFEELGEIRQLWDLSDRVLQPFKLLWAGRRCINTLENKWQQGCYNYEIHVNSGEPTTDHTGS
jgi:hypothetical protein